VAASIAAAIFIAICSPAAGAGGLVVVPHPASGPALSYLRLVAHPGRLTRAGTIGLLNTGPTPLRVAISAVPGRTIDTLGSTYGTPDGARDGAAAWLRLSRRTLAVASGASVQVPIFVAVPRSAAAGDVLAGLDVEGLGQKQDGGTGGVSIASAVRYVIGVEVSVPGPRAPLIAFTGASVERQPSSLVFLLDAVNRGNVILTGVSGSALITSGSRVVAHVPLGPGTFVTSSSIAYPVPVPAERPASGSIYRVRAYLRYGRRVASLDTLVRFGPAAAAHQRAYTAKPPTRKAVTGLPDWVWAVLGAALLYGLATGVLVLVWRRRRREDVMPIEAPPPAPTISSSRQAEDEEQQASGPAERLRR
jgi:hypothetical protein